MNHDRTADCRILCGIKQKRNEDAQIAGKVRKYSASIGNQSLVRDSSTAVSTVVPLGRESTKVFDISEFVCLLGIVNRYTDWSIAHNKDHSVLQFL